MLTEVAFGWSIFSNTPLLIETGGCFWPGQGSRAVTVQQKAISWPSLAAFFTMSPWIYFLPEKEFDNDDQPF